jgi:hypothetical protein
MCDHENDNPFCAGSLVARTSMQKALSLLSRLRAFFFISEGMIGLRAISRSGFLLLDIVREMESLRCREMCQIGDMVVATGTFDLLWMKCFAQVGQQCCVNNIFRRRRGRLLLLGWNRWLVR